MKTKPYLLLLPAAALILLTSSCSAPKEEEPLIIARAEVQVPCTDDFVEPAAEEADGARAALSVRPACGDLAEPNGKPGTAITVTGQGFSPNTETEFLWSDQHDNEFRHRQDGEYLKVTTDETGAFQVTMTMPYRLVLPKDEQEVTTWTLVARQGYHKEDTGPKPIDISIVLDHILLSFAGTLSGGILGISLAFGISTLTGAAMSKNARFRLLLILPPWRTIISIPLLFSLPPLYYILMFGLGLKAGIPSLATTMFVLSVLFATTLFNARIWPAPLPQAVSLLRTLLVIGPALAMITGDYGAGGLGFKTIMYIQLLDKGSIIQNLLLIASIMLAADLICGPIQLLLLRKSQD